MTRPRIVITPLLALALALAGCDEREPATPAGNSATKAPTPPPPATEREGKTPKDENVERFHDTLRAIARGYKAWDRVDDMMRWAPLPCADPGWKTPTRLSGTNDVDTHGRKLYLLYAKERDAYVTLGGDHGWRSNENASPPAVVPGTESLEQVVVKESWATHDAPAKQGPAAEARLEPVTKNGRTYHALAQSSLFIMYKLKDATDAGTDDGWVYGTVTPDGQQVNSAGRVNSCMSCHDSAPHDRLFGLQKS